MRLGDLASQGKTDPETTPALIRFPALHKHTEYALKVLGKDSPTIVSNLYHGVLFFGTNILAAFSLQVAVWIAQRIGLLNTMVFTHLPSNILLMLV